MAEGNLQTWCGPLLLHVIFPSISVSISKETFACGQINQVVSFCYVFLLRKAGLMSVSRLPSDGSEGFLLPPLPPIRVFFLMWWWCAGPSQVIVPNLTKFWLGKSPDPTLSLSPLRSHDKECPYGPSHNWMTVYSTSGLLKGIEFLLHYG